MSKSYISAPGELTIPLCCLLLKCMYLLIDYCLQLSV